MYIYNIAITTIAVYVVEGVRGSIIESSSGRRYALFYIRCAHRLGRTGCGRGNNQTCYGGSPRGWWGG